MKPSRQFGLNIQVNQHIPENNSKNPSKIGKSKRIVQPIVAPNLEKENFNITLQTKELKIVDHFSEKLKAFKLSPPCDPQVVTLYQSEIQAWMESKEKHAFRKLVDPFFMQSQPDIGDDQRFCVVNYLMKLCYAFKLRDETLFLTILVMDSYLSKCRVTMLEMELIAITSLFIATKYEEIYPPSLERLIMRTSLRKSEVLNQESVILQQMAFELSQVTSLQWLNFFSLDIPASQSKKDILGLARYVLESTLLKTTLYHYHPSQVAIGALFIACKWMKQSSCLKDSHTELMSDNSILRKLAYIFSTIFVKGDLVVNLKYREGGKHQYNFDEMKVFNKGT